MIEGVEWPAVGDTYGDTHGRGFTIREIRPSDPQGRHVVGVLRELIRSSRLGELNEVRESAYACDLQTFRIIWRRIV